MRNDILIKEASKISGITEQLDNIENELFKFKVYVKSYLKGDNTFRTISSVDKTITNADVRTLNAMATLENSYDWYIIQKLINESPLYSTIIFDGTYIIDLPLKINRTDLFLCGIKENYVNFNRNNSSRIIQKSKNTNGFEIAESVYCKNIHFQYLNIHGNQGDGVGADANGMAIKGSCGWINFNDCYIALWQNGVYHENGHFICSYFEKVQFSYCTKNGFFAKNGNTKQVNLIRFKDTGTNSCGLKYEGGKWVKNTTFTEFEGAGINISGQGITILDGANDICVNGIYLNKGNCNGISISGTYFEANTQDIYVTHSETGELKENISITGTMHVDAKKGVKFENENDRRKIYVYNSLNELHSSKCNRNETSATSGVINPLLNSSYENFKKYSLINKGDSEVLTTIKTVDLNDSYKIEFDYEYIGGSTYSVYSMVTYKEYNNSYINSLFITNTLNRRTSFSNIMKVVNSAVNNGNTTFTVENLENLSGATHVLVQPTFKDYNYNIKYGYVGGTYDLVPLSSITIDITSKTLTFNKVYGTNYLLYDPSLVLINKSVANENSTFFVEKGLYSQSGSVECYITPHKRGYPFLNLSISKDKALEMDFRLNLGRLADGQSLKITNFKCTKVDYPMLSKTELYNDLLQKGLIIRDSISKKLIVWDGVKWVNFNDLTDAV